MFNKNVTTGTKYRSTIQSKKSFFPTTILWLRTTPRSRSCVLRLDQRGNGRTSNKLGYVQKQNNNDAGPNQLGVLNELFKSNALFAFGLREGHDEVLVVGDTFREAVQDHGEKHDGTAGYEVN